MSPKTCRQVFNPLFKIAKLFYFLTILLLRPPKNKVYEQVVVPLDARLAKCFLVSFHLNMPAALDRRAVSPSSDFERPSASRHARPSAQRSRAAVRCSACAVNPSSDFERDLQLLDSEIVRQNLIPPSFPKGYWLSSGPKDLPWTNDAWFSLAIRDS